MGLLATFSTHEGSEALKTGRSNLIVQSGDFAPSLSISERIAQTSLDIVIVVLLAAGILAFNQSS